VAFRAGAAPGELWPGVADALYRLRRADRLAGETDFVMVKDLPDGDSAIDPSALSRFSYRPLETGPDMQLALDPRWKSYDDYLASMTTKYRKEAQKLDKDLAAAGYRVEPLVGLEAHLDRLYALYLEVHEAAQVRLFTLRPEYFSGLERTFGDRFRATAVKHGDELVGFVTTLADGPVAVGYHVGFDRARNAEVPIYFRLLRAAVGDAIALGATRLSLGRTALEPKAKLGAKPVPLSVWIRHRVPMMNYLVRGLLHTIHHDEAPERSVFKGDA
jgi:hypothetical protein